MLHLGKSASFPHRVLKRNLMHICSWGLYFHPEIKQRPPKLCFPPIFPVLVYLHLNIYIYLSFCIYFTRFSFPLHLPYFFLYLSNFLSFSLPFFTHVSNGNKLNTEAKITAIEHTYIHIYVHSYMSICRLRTYGKQLF
jgi:hypothetical protein